MCLVAGVRRDQFIEHVVIKPMQRMRDLAALLEIEDAAELPNNGNGSTQKPRFFFCVVRLDPRPSQFDRLNGRVVEQHDNLNSRRGHHLGLLILSRILSEHRSLPWTTLVSSR